MTVIPIEFATPEYDEAVAIRYAVLRKPLGLEYSPEQLSKEWADTHLACYADNGEMIGCLILSEYGEGTLKMRQVAVKETYQGKGVGKKMVEAGEAYARINGYKKIMLHAREAAIPFYQSLNYEIVSDMFQEVGINHKEMVKYLETSF